MKRPFFGAKKSAAASQGAGDDPRSHAAPDEVQKPSVAGANDGDHGGFPGGIG